MKRRILQLLERAKSFARALDHRLRRFVVYRAVAAVPEVFRHAACFNRAGEIAFYTLLSVIPFSALLLWFVASLLVGVAGPDWTPAEITGALQEMFPEVLPGAHATTEQIVAALLADRKTIGTFGFVALFISSALTFGAINRALGAVFEVKPRGQLSSVFLFSALASALGLVIFLALSLLSNLRAITAGQDSGLGATLQQNKILVELFSDLVLAGGFGFLVKFVARAPARWSHTFVGAVLFVASFEIARVVYAWYMASVARFTTVYGSLAGSMAAILWIYYVTFIFLVSMCLVRVLHDGRHRPAPSMAGRVVGTDGRCYEDPTSEKHPP